MSLTREMIESLLNTFDYYHYRSETPVSNTDAADISVGTIKDLARLALSALDAEGLQPVEIPREPGNVASHIGKNIVMTEHSKFYPGLSLEDKSMITARKVWVAMWDELASSKSLPDANAGAGK